MTTALLHSDGAYDRRAIMLAAHKTFRVMHDNCQPWSFARYLSFAWSKAKSQHAAITTSGNLRLSDMDSVQKRPSQSIYKHSQGVAGSHL